MMEEWRDIPGYIGLYRASNLGNIKSLDKIVERKPTPYFQKGRVLKPGRHTSGYLIVGLYGTDITPSQKIHRLVAKAFLPNSENKKCVNHKNSVRTDNRVENLEWVTHLENSQHAKAKGRISRGVGRASSKLTEENVLEIRRLYLEGWSLCSIAEKYTCKFQNIHCVVKRKTWKHI